MARNRIGIIGGTGLGDSLLRDMKGEAVFVETPFGSPSCLPVVAEWNGVEVAFIARHGEGHRFSPSHVPYRANIWALKHLGVSAIVASAASGSLREDIEPGHLIICDQVIDRTFRRPATFFDEGLVAHVEFAEPFCPWLRGLLARAGEGLGTTVHHAATYVCMEGPQFSTRAESNLHRSWGADLIGMTCMPEAKLAREAEMCYALVALPTDYDCWRPADASRGQDEILQLILQNLKRVTENARKLIGNALQDIGGETPTCRCGRALDHALWSDLQGLDSVVHERLEPLIRRCLADKEKQA